MKPFKRALAEKMDGRLESRLLQSLPSGFQAIGDIAILALKPGLMEFRQEIGKAALELLPRLKTVCVKFDAVRGNERLPSIERVSGNGTETVHRENGCVYRLDVARVMFSKGNAKERGRLANVAKGGETIVDMFAGIGYFSIPIAKSNPGSKIYALEINPVAVQYLRNNIELNRLKNIEPTECDNRKAPGKLKHVADRVLMGYLPGTGRFLDAAFGFLKSGGGIIHFHDICKDSELWEKPLGGLKQAAERHGMKMKILDRRVVKQYAPRTKHVVVDAEFRPS